ncbi:MAG: DNA topology modulation protein [Gammaproteobacteria bacterium]|jgi:adenylate kinase family enzyme
MPHISKTNQEIQAAPQRIMIVGRPGSGKSTFSIKLQAILNIPLFHLDKYFFEKNWVQRNYQDFLNQQQYFVDKPQWIIDGNSTKSFELRYSQADLCLYFNFPRYLCYYRTIKRLFHKHPAIDDRAQGCQETIRWSLLQYMWGFEKRVQPILSVLKSNYSNVKLIELRSDQDVICFTKNLQQVINSSQ